jgi:dihydroorotase-like cyclic amidohydrolase
MPSKPKTTLIQNAQVVNEGNIAQLDLLLENGFIAQVASKIDSQAGSSIIIGILLPILIDRLP